MSPKNIHPRQEARVLFVTCAFLCIAAFAFLFSEKMREAYEVTSVALLPNAQRSYEYGEQHFTSKDPSAYNIELANYFFWKAQALDPTLPYVYHEIARVSFLKGKFDEALVEINLQIANNGDKTPNSYYIRGLIEGFMGKYDDSIRDYKYYLTFDPDNWAAINDYSWVLLKAGRSQEALVATSMGLKVFGNNSWLLNSNAIALYETGHLEDARAQMQRAAVNVMKLSEKDWLKSYPGNDPQVALQGIASFKRATLKNLRVLSEATSTASTTTTHLNH